MPISQCFRWMIQAALFCGVAPAQLAFPLICNTTVTAPRTVRVEGVAELVSDVVLECTGGTPTVAGGAVPQVNFQMFLSTDVTGRLLATGFSEGLLLMDEPGSVANPNLRMCDTPTTGVCGTTGTGTGMGVYDGSAGRPNVFQARQTGINSLVWLGVPVDPPGAGKTRRIRMTDIRVNANRRGPAMVPMTPIFSFLAVTSTITVLINNPQIVVAYVGNGMDFGVNTPVTLAQCVAENPGLAANGASHGVSQFNLTFAEGFVESFSRRTIAAYVDSNTSSAPAAQTVPGTIWNTETGFFSPLFPAIVNRGDLGLAGLADQGTRILARFSGVPVNVKLFAQNTVAQGQMVARMVTTNADGEGPFSLVGGNGFGISPIPVNGSGEATMVFEVLRADAVAGEMVRVPIYVAYGTPLPGLGTASATGALAPLTVITAADATAPVARFVELNLSPAFTIAPCTGGRMTGGGSVFTTSTSRVTHGFELHCDRGVNPNRLQVNWNGNSFHLETLTSAVCSDDPSIAPQQPKTSFDTYVGAGTGRYNGVTGATATWTFTDAGEPGKNDTAQIVIKDSLGNTVLTVGGTLDKGNQQAH